MTGAADGVTLSAFLKVLFPEPKGLVTLVRTERGRAGELWFHDINGSAVDDQHRLGQLYYCVSTCEPVGRRSRRPSRKHPVLTYVIVLDDVGTKVPIDRLPPGARPTYALETSPSNFQLGFRLTDPVQPARAAALFDAIAKAGLTDPGSKSDVRLVRVPGSLNGKPKLEDFAARLTTWNPSLSYTYSELCIVLGVTPSDIGQRSSVPELAEGEQDHVAEWAVRHQGDVGGASGPPIRNLIPLLCPQADQHTVGVDRSNDSSTVWLPGSPGAFRCTHGHCTSFTTREYLAWCRKTYPGDPPPEHGQVTVDLNALGMKLRGALQLVSRETSTNPSLFPAPPYDVRRALDSRPSETLSLVERLTAHVAQIDLGAHVLPDAERTQAGGYRASQMVTQARVHTVMDAIGMTVRFNAMTRRPEADFPWLDWYDHEIDTSSAGPNALVHASMRCDMKGDRQVHGYFAQRAMEQAYHPALEWVMSVRWDGTDRLGALCETVCLADPQYEAWRAVALRRWLIQTCAALDNYDKGRKAEQVGYTLVLQGPQRRGKSSWVEALLPRGWVSMGVSLKLDGNERDAVMRATQTPITELGEVDATFRKADIAALKNFLTTPVDVYRMPYGHGEVVMPRCTTFVATVNPRSFLVDATGEGRFWPLSVTHCIYEHGIDLPQLWAQAWHLYSVAEESWWLISNEPEMHAKAAGQHHAQDSITEFIDELKALREAYPVERDKLKWIHAQAGQMLEEKAIRKGPAEFASLRAHLERAGFREPKIQGKLGWEVPNFRQLKITPAQAAGWSVHEGEPSMFKK